MSTSSSEPPTASARTCGCDKPPRRVCDVCRTADAAFIACSHACLDAHLVAEHPDVERSASARARAYQKAMNDRAVNDWERFASHRRRVTDIASARAAGPSLCIFGVGNGSDVNLADLSTTFDSLDLVDLDGSALERASARLPEALRERARLHANVNLSGFLDELDSASDGIPESEIAVRAVAAARGVVERLGRRFDTTLSTCVLSQLMLPYQRAWARTGTEWAALEMALTALHLSTLTGATRAGGTCILVFDVLSSKDLPRLADLVGTSSDDLATFVARETSSGEIPLRPDPHAFLEQLKLPALASMIAEPRLTTPWLWQLHDAVQLVWALVYRCPGTTTDD